MVQRKKLRTCRKLVEKPDLFDALPDDLLECVLSKLISSAPSPSDFINVLLTCKRLNRVGLRPTVLSQAGPKALAVKAKNWSDSAHRFLKRCVFAGNLEACYTLGMIRFYCLQNRSSGTSLMAKAAMKSHAPALYSLAVIQFNGSGGGKNEKDLRAGVALCARAASIGHVDAVRELGHCLQDGYGVRQNIEKGRRLLIEANAREFFQSVSKTRTRHQSYYFQLARATDAQIPCSPLLSDFGYNVEAPEVHPVNNFLKEWFESGVSDLGNGLRLCSYSGCGRPETRVHEYRRCSVCGKVNYCSRACQAIDWKTRHKRECVPPLAPLINDGDADGLEGMVEIAPAEFVGGH
ncbi:hypothetical protein CISIN_1g018965mg [Citrus sinensis]|uniref:MYND-type domain-containing protein n=2 Tax=Citrus sinensis TaxID=2711 RepID=A0A067EBY7_CITSI|nr:hypothetical protein CISIN_1g018965mg [Citrus sinensis]